MQLYYDKPVSKGVENALKRAKQMVELKWTPVRRMPASTIYRDINEVRCDVDTFFSPYRPHVGHQKGPVQGLAPAMTSIFNTSPKGCV